ncbi:hypothetical protein AGMMS49545_14710 [Betaproteobacteria bacterium]|nr:hypothetical protein AGMMS49545_14710 [Betaproteobacteria bacterium]GHU41643.1 hypothetical protein AGMMS50289_05140 [Betaproteobacteria bacterium]
MRYEDGSIWITHKELAELCGVDESALNDRLKKLFNDAAMPPEAATRKFQTGQTGGAQQRSGELEYYNLQMMIDMGFKVNPERKTKLNGMYLIAGLYFLFGLGLSFLVPMFNEVNASTFGDQWRPEQNPLIAPFFWSPYVWTLFFGACALLLCLTTRLSPAARARVNLGAWITLFILALHAMDWLHGFIFCHAWGCSHFLPTWQLLWRLN